MKWLRLVISYGNHFEGVYFPQLHDEEADQLSTALDTVFSWFEDDNVQITWPETGHKAHVLVYTEETNGLPDDKYDFENFLKLRNRFRSSETYQDPSECFFDMCKEMELENQELLSD